MVQLSVANVTRLPFPTRQQTAFSSRLPRVGRRWDHGERVPTTRHRAAIRPRILAQAASSLEGVKAVIEDLPTLGTLRFICIGDGGILESAQKFDEVSYNEVPNKGTYCTLKTTDRAFEAHIALAKVSEVKMVKGRPRTGEYDIYKVSFLREDGGPMLTCLLHGPEGNYEPGAIEAWEALWAKNGETGYNLQLGA